MYIDAHFHTNVYNRYENALVQALAILNELKILIVSSSTDPDSYQQTLEIAVKSKYVLPCFGIHPQVAHEYLDKLDALNDLFDQAIAFGEIGLDHYYLKDESQYPAQYTLLEHFFSKARDQDKLVVLHLDGAEEQGYEMIKKFSLTKVIVHGYKGSLETMRKLLGIGCYFSVGGNMILDAFKQEMTEDDWILFQSIIKEIPSNRLLVETDGPCRMEPTPPEGAPRSMPSYIFEMITKIASVREISSEQLQESTNNNFKQLIQNDEFLKSYSSLIV
ncbi:MAG: TatD family hydrolase [Asgard group archaeon]|nr:TatD family hydrolase [Asgard group archaeon]